MYVCNNKNFAVCQRCIPICCIASDILVAVVGFVAIDGHDNEVQRDAVKRH